jgi:hypothetical protein
MCARTESASVDVSQPAGSGFRAITDEGVEDVDYKTDFAHGHDCHWRDTANAQ